MHKYYSSKTFQFFAIVIISSLCVLLDTLTKINFSKMDLPKNHPQYNALGIEGSVYNKRGRLLYNLTSSEGWEYPDDEKIFLRSLKLNVYSESSDVVKYVVTSDDGWVNQSTKVGKLGDNTVATITDPDPAKTVVMYATAVDLDMDKQIFSSQAEAHATQGKSVIYTHGFSYDNNKQFLVLNSKVRVVYVQ